MTCPKCGSPIEPADTFCPNCGNHLVNIPPQQSAPVVPKEYKPISPWGYIGWSILFSLPVVGFILLIVFSFSKANLNRRNYARSYWCALLLLIIVVALGVIALAVTGQLGELTEYLKELSSAFSY